jgi:hypothetical protein
MWALVLVSMRGFSVAGDGQVRESEGLAAQELRGRLEWYRTAGRRQVYAIEEGEGSAHSQPPRRLFAQGEVPLRRREFRPHVDWIGAPPLQIE